MAFIGDIQPQFFIRGAYSSTGENNALLSIFFGQSVNVLGPGKTQKRAEVSSRAVAIRSPKKQVTVAGVNGNSGYFNGNSGVFLLFSYLVDLYLFRARRRCGLLVTMMSLVVAAWTRFVVIRAIERKSNHTRI